MNGRPKTDLRFTASEWPHGLICETCERPFKEGQVIALRLDAMLADTPITSGVCIECDLGVR